MREMKPELSMLPRGLKKSWRKHCTLKKSSMETFDVNRYFDCFLYVVRGFIRLVSFWALATDAMNFLLKECICHSKHDLIGAVLIG